MSHTHVLKFDPSLRSFPTFRGVLRGLLAVVTLGRSGTADRVGATLERFHLPEDLHAMVLSTTRATGLWPSEQQDVARELASHFRAGLDAGTPADTLAMNFGDAAVSAKLIRRAAHRKRPLPWRVWSWCWKGTAALLLALLVVYGLLTVWYYAGSPTIKRNFFNELNGKILATPADQRAWPEYRRALMAMPDLPNDEVQNDWPAISPDDPQYVNAVAYIKAAAPQLDIVRAAAKRPTLGAELLLAADEEFEVRMAERRRATPESIQSIRDTAVNAKLPENPDAISILLPSLGRIRSLARDLMFDTAVARREGDGPRVAANIEAIIGIAHQTGHEETLIGQLVGYAVLHVAVNEVKTTISETPALLTDEQFSRIAHAMAVCIEPGTLTPDLSGERVYMEDLMQRLYTDDGQGDGRLTDEGMDYLMGVVRMSGDPSNLQRRASPVSHAVGPVYAQLLAGRKDIMHEYNRVMDLMIASAERPAWVRIADPNHQRLEEVFENSTWTARYLPIKVLMPAIGKAYWAGQRTSLERDVAMTATACELHRRRTGAWPTSLTEIPRQLLPAVPVDPFTGKAVLYRVTDGTPMLYSTGNDQDDDGGTATESTLTGRTQSPEIVADGDWVLWPVPKKQ